MVVTCNYIRYLNKRLFSRFYEKGLLFHSYSYIMFLSFLTGMG